MVTYNDIKNKMEHDTNELFRSLGVFWAFSNEQFTKGFEEIKPKMADGEKIVSIGGGGYLPKSKARALFDGIESIEKTFKASIKENKARQKHILYELNNHEAFYTCRLDEALQALGEDYTDAEVMEVYKKYKAKKYCKTSSI